MKLFFFSLLLLFISSKSYSIDVQDTIENTILNNPKIKIGLEKLTESKELIENSIGQKLPNVTTSISGTFAKSELNTSTSSTTPETFTDSYKLTVTQNLYDAGYNDLEIERSKILYENEIINFKITIQNLILDAVNGYLTVINNQKSLEATKKNFESISKALEETKTKYDLGSASLYELQSAQSSFAIANANLFAAKQNVIISKKTFYRIAGLEPINLEDNINIDDLLNFDSSIKNALKNNLNLLKITNDIASKEILLLKEKKTKKPNLDFTGTAEYSDSGRIDPGTETTKGSLAITLTIPLFQQGIDNSNIRKYRSQILQSELNYEDYIADLQILISNSFKDFHISKINMDSNKAIIKASETSLEKLKQEFLNGTKTITDVIDEESQLLSAKVDFFNSKKDYLNNYFKIKSYEGLLLNIFEKYLPEFY